MTDFYEIHLALAPNIREEIWNTLHTENAYEYEKQPWFLDLVKAINLCLPAGSELTDTEFDEDVYFTATFKTLGIECEVWLRMGFESSIVPRKGFLGHNQTEYDKDSFTGSIHIFRSTSGLEYLLSSLFRSYKVKLVKRNQKLKQELSVLHQKLLTSLSDNKTVSVVELTL